MTPSEEVRIYERGREDWAKMRALVLALGSAAVFVGFVAAVGALVVLR